MLLPAPNPEYLSFIAGAVLSLLMSYVPGLRQRFALLTPTGRRIVMAFLLALAAIGTTIWRCTGSVDYALVCVQGSMSRELVTAFFWALMANQSTHRITTRRKGDPDGRC